MKRRVLFLLVTFFVTVLLMAIQKPIFALWYHELFVDTAFNSWFHVLTHGLSLDITVAGYITALPALLTLISIWVNFSDRLFRQLLAGYFIAISILVSAILSLDLSLYEHWGFRIDGTILIYLDNPQGAMASLDLVTALRQGAIFTLYATLLCWVYLKYIIPIFRVDIPRSKPLSSLLTLFLCGLCFLAIRGGVGASVANISRVYFSSNQLLNHAAINPVFSLLSTIGKNDDYASEYPFYSEDVRSVKLEALMSKSATPSPTDTLLTNPRPNILFVVLESFGRPITDETIDGVAVTPHLQELKNEGVWFENMYANSFRTDRGQVAILSGFPAQTRISIMKMPTKSSMLPSIASTLQGEGYSTSFYYGGDLNFTNQASYMYSTGWEELVWQKDLNFNAPTGKWGYADDVMSDYVADAIIARSSRDTPFLAGYLTLSSHEPFDVPYSKFDDPLLNAMSFTDEQIGKMISKLKASPAWENLLVVLVADHSIGYPYDLSYNEPKRHHIPMLWLGGALKGSKVVNTYTSQIDISATLLSQMGISHSEYKYSRDIFSNEKIPNFGYYVFNNGFGVIDSTSSVVYDCTTNQAIQGDSPELIDIGKTILQSTYVDIANF